MKKILFTAATLFFLSNIYAGRAGWGKKFYPIAPYCMYCKVRPYTTIYFQTMVYGVRQDGSEINLSSPKNFRRYFWPILYMPSDVVGFSKNKKEALVRWIPEFVDIKHKGMNFYANMDRAGYSRYEALRP